MGWHPAGRNHVSWSGTAGLLRSLTPARLMDTRNGFGGSGKLVQGKTVTLQVTGRGLVPNSHVSAVVLNVTAANPTASGYLSLFPAGQRPQIITSNLNFVRGQLVPNRVIVPLDGTDREELHRCADGELYAAKHGSQALPGGGAQRDLGWAASLAHTVDRRMTPPESHSRIS